MLMLKRIFWVLVMLFSTVLASALWTVLTNSPSFPRFIGVALWAMFVVGMGGLFFRVYPRPVRTGRHES
jgi:hypothetical protein